MVTKKKKALSVKFLRAYVARKSARIGKKKTTLLHLLRRKRAAGLVPGTSKSGTFVWKAGKKRRRAVKDKRAERARSTRSAKSFKKFLGSSDAARARALGPINIPRRGRRSKAMQARTSRSPVY